MMPLPEGDIAIAALMKNLSVEAGRLVQTAQRIDDMLGAFAAENGQVAQSLAVELQDVDVLRQALAAIQQITASAAQQIPASPKLQVSKRALAAGVTLEGVRDACLNGHDVIATVASPTSGPCTDNHAQAPMFFDDI